MKTTTRNHRNSKLASLPLILSLALALGACGSETTLGPAPEAEDDETPPAEARLYQVTIKLDHLTVVGTCDGEDNAGDFDYTIEIWGRDEEDRYVLYKELTGYFEGYPEQTHTLAHEETFFVEPGKNYYVGFKATDRDPAGNEDDFVGYEQNVNTTGGQLAYDHRLKIGGSGCGMTLTYEALETAIY